MARMTKQRLKEYPESHRGNEPESVTVSPLAVDRDARAHCMRVNLRLTNTDDYTYRLVQFAESEIVRLLPTFLDACSPDERRKALVDALSKSTSEELMIFLTELFATRALWQ